MFHNKSLSPNVDLLIIMLHAEHIFVILLKTEVFDDYGTADGEVKNAGQK